jgi:hypothetical protein
LTRRRGAAEEDAEKREEKGIGEQGQGLVAVGRTEEAESAEEEF